MSTRSAPSVSIGMPVYNTGQFLSQSIEALLQQDFDDFELILADNHSTDQSQAVCLEYAGRDRRIRYQRNRRNLGSQRNFNLAFELSQGQYFMWARSNDLWHPSFVRRCAAVLANDSETVLCHTQCREIDAQGDVQRTIPENLDTRGLAPLQRVRETWAHIVGPACCGLIRSSAIDRTSRYFAMPGCDVAFLSELSTLGAFAYIDQPLYFLRTTRAEASEDETVARTYQQLDPYHATRRPVFKTRMLDYYAIQLRMIERLDVEPETKSNMLSELINVHRDRYGGSSLAEAEALARQVTEMFDRGEMPLQLLQIGDGYYAARYYASLALDYVNIGLLFHPDSEVLQQAYDLLFKHARPLSYRET